VRCCNEIPLFAIFVGSVPHIRVAVRYFFAVRVALGVWKNVLRCISQRCCSAIVLPGVCCSGCVVGRVAVCVAVELLCGLLFQCVLQYELFLQRVSQWVCCWVLCSVCYSANVFFFGFGLDWLCGGV